MQGETEKEEDKEEKKRERLFLIGLRGNGATECGRDRQSEDGEENSHTVNFLIFWLLEREGEQTLALHFPQHKCWTDNRHCLQEILKKKKLEKFAPQER